MYTRVAKVLLVWSVALFASLAVFDNLSSYHFNFVFVEHVLMMNTTVRGNGAMWRAVHSPFVQNLSFCLIIFTEGVIAVLCWLGGFNLFRSIKDAARFNRAKGLAIAGLALGILLWFTGFITIGGQWFLMWLSRVWNAEQAAFRFTMLMGIVLLLLIQRDGQEDA